VFGPITRKAIHQWQESQGRRLTGFLDNADGALLEQQAASIPAQPPSAAPKAMPVAKSPQAAPLEQELKEARRTKSDADRALKAAQNKLERARQAHRDAEAALQLANKNQRESGCTAHWINKGCEQASNALRQAESRRLDTYNAVRPAEHDLATAQAAADSAAARVQGLEQRVQQAAQEDARQQAYQAQQLARQQAYQEGVAAHQADVARQRERDKELGFTAMAFNDFLLDGNQLAEDGTKVSVSGIYQRTGDNAVLWRNSVALKDNLAHSRIPLLIENATRDTRSALLRCDQEHRYGCDLTLLGARLCAQKQRSQARHPFLVSMSNMVGTFRRPDGEKLTLWRGTSPTPAPSPPCVGSSRTQSATAHSKRGTR